MNTLKIVFHEKVLAFFLLVSCLSFFLSRFHKEEARGEEVDVSSRSSITRNCCGPSYQVLDDESQDIVQQFFGKLEVWRRKIQPRQIILC